MTFAITQRITFSCVPVKKIFLPHRSSTNGFDQLRSATEVRPCGRMTPSRITSIRIFCVPDTRKNIVSTTGCTIDNRLRGRFVGNIYNPVTSLSSSSDYVDKADQFQQDCMPCTASRQTSKFICFAHFNPTLNEFGHNIGDVTEVFAFHSNCLKQDSQSIRRCLTHVTENLKDRGHLKSRAHLWADGSAAQNKGRKAFRNLSELSLTEAIEIIQNFACTHHFEGPWDTEGGRETHDITSHIRNG